MPGLDDCLKIAVGGIRQAINEMRGAKFEYILHRDSTVAGGNPTTLTIFMSNTPTDINVVQELGVDTEETVDDFVVSHQEFIISGTEFRPNKLDRWRALDSTGVPTGPKYRPILIQEPRRYTSHYMLRGRARFRHSPSGTGTGT